MKMLCSAQQKVMKPCLAGRVFRFYFHRHVKLFFNMRAGPAGAREMCAGSWLHVEEGPPHARVSACGIFGGDKYQNNYCSLIFVRVYRLNIYEYIKRNI